MLDMTKRSQGLVIASVVLLAAGTANGETNVDLHGLVDVIEKYVLPIMQSVQVRVSEVDSNEVQDSETRKRNMIEKMARRHLKEYTSEEVDISDDDVSEDTLILESPSSESKRNHTEDHFEKYEKLQRKIKRLLGKERISNETKGLITDVFDKVVTQMTGKCWNTSPKNRRLANDEQEAWNAKLKEYRKKFNELIDSNRKMADGDVRVRHSEESANFLTNLRDFFFEMHSSLQTFTGRKDVECNIVDVVTKNIGRESKKHSVEKDAVREINKTTTCQIEKICPFELKIFTAKVEKSLLETSELLFNNYEKMYLLDLTQENSGEQEIFLKVITNARKRVSEKFNNTVAKEIAKPDLLSITNIKKQVHKLNEFIDASVDRIKKIIDDAITNLGTELPVKIRDIVKKDIMTNADIEFISVQDKIKTKKMCKIFQTCYWSDRGRKLNNMIFY